MRSTVRALVAGAAALLAGLVVVGAVLLAAMSSHRRAAVVLVRTLDVPLGRALVGALTREPVLEERRVAGVPTTVARPAGGAGTALVFVNGVTERGRRHPAVRRLADALARVGLAAYVPDVSGLRTGEITERTVEDTVAVALAAVEETGAPVAFAGVSVGTTVALLAAEEPELKGRVSLVAGIAPYADLADVIRLATTGRTALAGPPRRHLPDPFVGLVVARSLLAGLPPGEERDALLDRLRRVHPQADAPLSALAEWPRPADPTVAAALDLLANRDPERFDALYARLPAEIRRRIHGLSPLARADALRARVELASAPRDKYFPLEHSRALAASAPQGRLTVTRTLEHAVPRADLDDLRDLARFYGFLVRALDVARGGR